jgi:hypothetical protein
VSFATIVESNGIGDALWCCRAEPQHARVWRLFAVKCARRALARVSCPDPRSIAACDVAERHAAGLATDEELRRARSAAYDAAYATADAAAYSSAYASAAAASADAASAAYATYAAYAAAAAYAASADAASADAAEEERRLQAADFLGLVS